MKTKILAGVAVVWLLASGSASASIFTSGTLNLTVPDGDPVGITSTLNVSGLAGNILSSGDNVSLTLNITGGNNGDLYAYLSYNGHIVALLNRPGVTGGNPPGYADPGFNVTLSDGSHVNINSYGGNGGAQLTGTYNAGGGSVAFQTFNGLSPNGTWTLFIADMSGGDLSYSQLVSWSLNITAVPEPVDVALAVFGMLFAVVIVARRRAKKLAGNRQM